MSKAEPWLSIVGIGEDGYGALSPAARGAVDDAKLVVGGSRHLAMLPASNQERVAWPTPFDPMLEQLEKRAPNPTCVLATGDPMCFGVGERLVAHFGIDHVRVFPSLSAFALARARLGWATTNTSELSIHGRPIDDLTLHLFPGARLLVLAQDSTSPSRLDEHLISQGFEGTRMWALERMGGPFERIHQWRAGTDAVPIDVHPLHTIAIECGQHPKRPASSRVPGLPDEAFEHDGQLTKRVIRAITICALAPLPGEHLWDLGAGCGSIAIEFLRAISTTRATAVEQNPKRVELIERNALALGVPRLEVINGDILAILDQLRPPDAVFIGGGLSVNSDLVDRCLSALRPNGRLVINTVTLEGERKLIELQSTRGGDLTRLDVAHLDYLGAHAAMKPSRSVLQWRVRPCPRA